MSLKPARGDVWLADLEPATNWWSFSQSRAKGRNIPLRVQLEPSEGGLRLTSYVMPEMIRSVSTQRLRQRLGAVSAAKMASVEADVRILLGLA